MTQSNVWMATVAIGTLFGIFIFPIWIKKSSLTWKWVRAIGWLILGALIGYILGGNFSSAKDTTIYILIAAGYVIGFALTCTEFPNKIFSCFPDWLQNFIKCVAIAGGVLLLICFVFRKTIKWALGLIIVLFILALLKALVFKRLPKKVQHIIAGIIMIYAVGLILWFFVHKIVEIMIIIALFIVFAIVV